MERLKDEAVSEQIRKFLFDFKQAATEGGVYLVPRQGSCETLHRLGLTKRNLEALLLGLSVADCCGTLPGGTWLFGGEVDGREVCLELGLVYTAGGPLPCCEGFLLVPCPRSA